MKDPLSSGPTPSLYQESTEASRVDLPASWSGDPGQRRAQSVDGEGHTSCGRSRRTVFASSPERIGFCIPALAPAAMATLR